MSEYLRLFFHPVNPLLPAVTALVLLLGSCSEQPAPDTVTPAAALTAETNWLVSWLSQSYAGFSCSEFQRGNSTALAEQVFFPEMLLNRFNAGSFFSAVFTNRNKNFSGPLRFFGAEFPTPLHAFGIYSSIPAGIDQSAIRGGPSKRVGTTLVALKNNRVVWTYPVLNGTRPALYDYEIPFSTLCEQLPGATWVLPPDVASLSLIEPPPLAIEFTPEHYLGLPFFPGALRARFYSSGQSVELFSLILPPGETGYDQLRAFMLWLKQQGMSAMVVSLGQEQRLFVNEPALDPLYLVAGTNHLYGVKGLSAISDAQALLARWQP